MILFPAIDIKEGQCVRLHQGRKDEVTVFSQDPVAMAKHWAQLGAKWLHVVDLDGAFEGKPRNAELIADICRAVDVPVQLGGGIRDLATAQSYIRAGVSRLIVGTMALVEPGAFGELCQELSGKVGVSLDAADGNLKTKGWVEDAGLTVEDVLPRLTEQGVSFLIYTDIYRDGTQTGPNLEALGRLLGQTDLPVIAAGGLSTLQDIKNLSELVPQGLAGAISGQAIYTGSLDFAEAMAWLARQ